jgi:hypothetical protein
VTTFEIYSALVATYSDGSAFAVTGYNVYCSSKPGYITEYVIDVGMRTKVPLTDIIPADGTWYLSASGYDASGGESSRSREIADLVVEGVVYPLVAEQTGSIDVKW